MNRYWQICSFVAENENEIWSVSNNRKLLHESNFNGTTATQSAYHLRLILPTPPPSERRTSQPYGVYWIPRFL